LKRVTGLQQTGLFTQVCLSFMPRFKRGCGGWQSVPLATWSNESLLMKTAATHALKKPRLYSILDN